MISTYSCKGQDEKLNYANNLKSCLTDNDIIELNKATNLFEEKLKTKYGSENINQNYLTYLKDLAMRNINPQFFLDNDSALTLKSLDESGTSNKIWISNTDSKGRSFMTLDKDGAYLKCMLNKNKNETIKEVISMQAELGGISPGLTSRAITENLTETDFNDGLNKVVIAIGFYYELSRLFRQRQK